MEDLVRTYAVLWVWRSDAPMRCGEVTVVVLTRAFTPAEAKEQTLERAQLVGSRISSDTLPMPRAALVVPVEADGSFRIPKMIRAPDGVMVRTSGSQARDALCEFRSSCASEDWQIGP